LFPQIAVDTWRSATARTVLEAGADMINDISGASFDPAMAETVGAFKPAYVLMHTPARPEIMQRYTDYANVTDAVLLFFERQMALLVKAGLPESHIALDPGIGFGKTAEQNLELLRNARRLAALGRPLYVGVSRKSFLGALFGLPVAGRDAASQVLTALLARAGVLAHRVHDVAGAVQALRLEKALAAE
jgi:dihydropteroate synthase